MDDVATADFQDWELLHNSDSDSVQETNDSEDIEDESEGIIKRDYFSLDSELKYTRIVGNDEEGSVDSDNPSWIDPDSVTQSPRRDLAGFWSDSGSDGSEVRKLEMGFAENGKTQVGFEVRELGFDEIEEKGDDCCGNGGIEEKNEEGIGGNDEKLEEKMCNGDEEGEKRRMMIWWKLPLEILKYCVIRINPVWSVSVAAAVMGFVILGRRYYRMKKKSRSLELNVTMDDKKVSQFMSKVARLNEAFSVVKRVPIIRPSLPATGVTPWPIMALR